MANGKWQIAKEKRQLEKFYWLEKIKKMSLKKSLKFEVGIWEFEKIIALVINNSKKIIV